MTGREPIIYVVDDDVSICRSLKMLLGAHGFRVETFTSAAAFLGFKHLERSSCLLLDLFIPDLNGMAVLDIMADRKLAIPIVFITGHGTIPVSVKAMKRGAVDFLPKPFTQEDLLNAVERAVSRSKVEHKEGAEVAAIKRRMKALSPRELEVFYLVAKGMLNKQIATKLGTVLQTVKVHRGRVMHKMEAKTVRELIAFAQKAGIVFA